MWGIRVWVGSLLMALLVLGSLAAVSPAEEHTGAGMGGTGTGIMATIGAGIILAAIGGGITVPPWGGTMAALPGGITGVPWGTLDPTAAGGHGSCTELPQHVQKLC